MDNLVNAIPIVFQWQNLLAMVIGTTGGIVIGALPGLSATMGIAILIPLTFTMEPLTALSAMAGIYNGAMFGGAIPAILLRIPGTPAAIATTFDGYPMTQKGESAHALEVAVTASGIGGMISAISLMLFSPLLVQLALMFGPAEYFWVAVFGLSTIAAVLTGSTIKGLISAMFGLFLGTVGIDMITGVERFTFGITYLIGGFDLIVLLIGLYSIPQAFIMAEEALVTGGVKVSGLGQKRRLFHGWQKLWPTWVRSSLIGIVVGIIPAAGGNIGSILGWNEAKRASKHPEEFGTGIPEGVAAAECTNSADNASALIPALTLGVPGNAVAAVIIGGLLVHGMRPGPSLFTATPDIAYGFMIAMFVTAGLQLIIGWSGATLFAQFLKIPRLLLVPIIVSLSTIGVYTLRNDLDDVWGMLVFGLIGYLMTKLDIPLAPAVIALILGPMAESELRRALLTGGGGIDSLFRSHITTVLVIISVLALAYPAVRALLALRDRKRRSDSERDEGSDQE